MPSVKVAFERACDRALAAVTNFVVRGLIEEAVEAFRDWKPGRNLGSKELRSLHAKADKHGYKICGSPACCDKVRRKEEFRRSPSTKSGLQSECTRCRTRTGKRTTSAARKDGRIAAAKRRGEAKEKKDSSAVENRASAWLRRLYLVTSLLGFEFRHDDILTPVSEQLPPDPRKRLFYPLQVKASEANASQAHFAHCLGYSEKGKETTMVLIHTLSNGDVKAWVLDGRKVTKDNIAANLSTGILAEKNLNLKDTPLDKLQDRIMEVAKEVGRTTTEYTSFLHITRESHRKEVALMLAVEQATGMQSKFPDGNQATFDFWLGGLRTQAKTEQGGTIPLHHWINGERDCPYSHDDPIDQFLGGSIWRSGDAYWVIYTTVPMWKAVELGVVDEEPANPKCVTISYGNLAPWLIGHEAPIPKASNLANSGAYQWKVAELKDTDRLPGWFLADAARDVADSSKEPVEEE